VTTAGTEFLWSPWRQEYIESDKTQGCFLCDKQKEDDREALILQRSQRGYVLLNAYPYNPGHAIVAPYRHEGELERLDDDETGDCSRMLQRAIKALKDAMNPDGFNLGVNLGRVAGAGVPDHLHWHVVPRWNGDTNFMPVLGKTKVLSELLAQTYEKVKPLF
jgi:ATP adenylyltransferase